MAEFDHNQYPDSNQNQQDPHRKVPEYSFWAEQMPSNQNYQNNSSSNPNSNPYTYPNTKPDPGSWGYGNTAEASRMTGGNRRKGSRFLRFLLKAACFGIIAGISFVGFQKVYYYINPEESVNLESGKEVNDKLNLEQPASNANQIGKTKTGNYVTTDSETVISEVADSTMPAIVSIKSLAVMEYDFFGREYSDQSESSGSGIIVNQTENELFIATNNHVVQGASQITVTFIDGSEAEAIIKGTDATADLAVITVELKSLDDKTMDAIEVAKLGTSEDMKVGHMVIAIGNALGYGQSLTVGYISAKDRKVEVSDGYTSKTMVLLQTDAAINPGNSGGALLNIDGEVIGINTVKYAANEVEGMGYAIPITRAIPIINELISREILSEEEQGYLGVYITDITEDLAAQLNMPVGVMITGVTEDGAANKAGLVYGDIIVGLNGIEITSGMQLKEKVSSIRAGSEVELDYMRNMNGTYEKQTVTIVLGTNPNLGAEANE